MHYSLMERSLQSFVKSDLDKKIVILSGPRQVGKTTLAKKLFPQTSDYFNMDREEDRRVVKTQSWRRDGDLVVFDELHKLKKWKNWIKGVFDSEGVRPRLLVTGSARMDIHRKGGDSLAGRFYSYRLHPFSVAEAKGVCSAEEALDRIMKLGGFPEPFLSDSESMAKRWRRSHIDRILREDLRDIAAVRDVRGVETLVELLRQSVGSLISYDSLSRELQVSPHTVKNWIGMLENLHILFLVTPYSRNIARSLLKAPKAYFYDTGFIADDPGARFENAVACALIKRLHFLEDTTGERVALHYLRDKEKREVDFLTVRDGKPEWLIETKTSQIEVAAARRFAQTLGQQVEAILLVKNLKRELQQDGVHVKRAADWLARMDA